MKRLSSFVIDREAFVFSENRWKFEKYRHFGESIEKLDDVDDLDDSF